MKTISKRESVVQTPKAIRCEACHAVTDRLYHIQNNHAQNRSHDLCSDCYELNIESKYTTEEIDFFWTVTEPKA